MNPLRIFWSDTRGKVIVTLIALWIGALINSFQLTYVSFPIVAVGAMSLFDLLISRIRTGTWVVTLSSVVTGFLIGLIFDPTASYLLLVIACLVAALTKQFLAAGNHQHIFNPATLGLVVTSLIFNRDIAWWGAAWGVAPVIIIAIGMALALSQIRRMWMPVTFLFIYFIFLGLSGTWSGAVHLTLDGTIFLFAFVMMPEPITSIGGGKWVYLWPALVAALVVIQTILRIFVTDPILLALLIANGIGFLFVRRPWVTMAPPSAS